MSETLTGTCLCGGVELEVTDPQALGYCHCSRCQHWVGSSLAGIVVAKENFGFAKGEDLVKTYESHLAPRNFCSNCGSSLWDDLGAVNFVLRGLLGTGATSTLRLDGQAKALGEWLRSRSTRVPRALVKDCRVV